MWRAWKQARVRMCSLHVILKCAYPVIFRTVNTACSVVFREVS